MSGAARPPAAQDGSLREILRLAVPALGALVAQPLFVLVDVIAVAYVALWAWARSV